MSFFANDLKQKKAEIERESRLIELQRVRRKKITLGFLIAFVILSTLTILVYTGSDPDEVRGMKTPESRKMIIDRWQAEGLLIRFDSLAYTAVVDEQKWAALDYVEKSNVTLTLGRYCMTVNHSTRPRIRITGSAGGRVLMRINDADAESPVQTGTPDKNSANP